MKKGISIFCIVLFLPASLFARNNSESCSGKEIRNTVSAVKTARPGDYILLPSGKKYIVTKEEIAIVKGEFDYENLSGVETTVEKDGTEIKTISGAHIAYMYPDGQAAHVLKTGISFTAFMNHIRETFFLARYVDLGNDIYEYAAVGPPRFSVFRASVQYQTISDGIEELRALDITVYNFGGEHKHLNIVPNRIWYGGIFRKEAHINRLANLIK